EIGRLLTEDGLLGMHHGCFRRFARLDGSMNCRLSFKLGGILGKALEKVRSGRLFTYLLAQQEFAVDEVESLFLGRQTRVHLQIDFRRHALALLPALPLIDAQRAHDLPRWDFAGLGELLQKLVNVGSLPLLPEPFELSGWLLGE